MKLFSSLPLLMGALFLIAGAVSGTSNGIAEPASVLVGPLAQNMPVSATVSGNWQVLWTGANGNQRQGTMQIKQEGSSLAARFKASVVRLR